MHYRSFSRKRNINNLVTVIVMCRRYESSFVLFSVDLEEAAADGGEVGSLCRMFVPAVAHQLQQLRVGSDVVRRDRRTKRRRLSATHTNQYIYPSRSLQEAQLSQRNRATRCVDKVVPCFTRYGS